MLKYEIAQKPKPFKPHPLVLQPTAANHQPTILSSISQPSSHPSANHPLIQQPTISQPSSHPTANHQPNQRIYNYLLTNNIV
jgi:hypothetical protein